MSSLIFTVESLQCHVCGNEECTNTTLVTCPILSTVCITVTAGGCQRSHFARPDQDGMTDLCYKCNLLTAPIGFTVALSGSLPVLAVRKNCSSLTTCVTPIDTSTEWSVNRGFAKTAFNQLCCMSDSCNFPTLAGKKSSSS